MMRYLFIKNKNLYKNIYDNEVFMIFLKSVLYNEALPTYIRQKAMFRLKGGVPLISVRNRCFFTNNARSVLRLFKISRIKLR